MQKTKSAAAQATDELPIALPYLRQIYVHLAFSSSGQKDDSHMTHFTVNSMCIMLGAGNTVWSHKPHGTWVPITVRPYCITIENRVYFTYF